jgi:hypothetical protein
MRDFGQVFEHTHDAWDEIEEVPPQSHREMTAH